MKMSAEERLKNGLLFAPGDPVLKELKRKAHNLNLDYNRTYEDEVEKRAEILRQLVGNLGEGSFLQGPVTFHYGVHTSIGKGCFINFNITIQDDASVEIGDHCNIGPNVTIVTPVHPMLPAERRLMLDENGVPGHFCFAKPVKIGHDCWIGANVVVCPGVTIGENCVIGAGSVVTKNIPADSFAAGNPCRVIRPITEADSMVHFPERLGEYRVIG